MSGVVPDALWNEPCVGYNVHYSLPASEAGSLAKIQQELLRIEPTSLVVCPPSTLHISVAWILGTKTDYGSPKTEIWAQIDRRCYGGLRTAAAAMEPFTVTFGELVVTDTAVIAVGEDGGAMSKLRGLIAASMPIPDATLTATDIVHVTLLRYARRFDPRCRLVDAAEACRFQVVTFVDRLAIVHETIYPSLETRALFSASLGAR
jgi:hypothetical protein